MIYFVLDTNVLLSEGKQALYQFEDDHVVIPMVVLNELDKKKSDSELGYMARSVLKEVSAVFSGTIALNSASLGDGFGDLLLYGTNPYIESDAYIPLTADGDILRTAHTIQEEVAGEDDEVVIVTKDIQFSIIARLNGFEAVDLVVEDRSEVVKHIRSVETYYISEDEMSYLYKEGTVRLDINVPRNIGVVLKSTSGSALAVSDAQWKFNLVKDDKTALIQGRNAEQRLAMSLLTDERIGVVSLTGPAGSGKSFLALDQAMKEVKSHESPIDKVIVYRPINAVGGPQQELGFLPGTIDEKMAPHLEAVQDTLEAVTNSIDAKKYLKDGTVKVDSVSYVRGRTIANTAIIVEEAQNLEYATLLTLLTRAGANTRVFLVWDMSQRDNQYIKRNDGVHRVVNKLIGNKLFAHIPFSKSERSAISNMAVELLDEL